jgi:hypothetical protein
MPTKLPLIILAVLSEVFCIFVFCEADLRKRPQGQKLLDLIENETIRFTSWRANADIKDELERIKRFCGWGLGSLILLTLVAAVFKLQWLSIFIAPFLIVSFFGYISLEWTTKWRTVLKFYFGAFLLLVASILFAHHSDLSQYRQLASLSVQFGRIVGITDPVPSLTLTLLLSAAVFVLLLLLMTIVAVVVSLGVFTPLWVTSRLSILFNRKVSKNLLWWTAFGTQLSVVILNGVINIL